MSGRRRTREDATDGAAGRGEGRARGIARRTMAGIHAIVHYLITNRKRAQVEGVRISGGARRDRGARGVVGMRPWLGIGYGRKARFSPSASSGHATTGSGQALGGIRKLDPRMEGGCSARHRMCSRYLGNVFSFAGDVFRLAGDVFSPGRYVPPASRISRPSGEAVRTDKRQGWVCRVRSNDGANVINVTNLRLQAGREIVG